MRNDDKAQAVERMKAHARFLPAGYTFDRDKANARRATIAAAQATAKDNRTEDSSAARSQDFPYSEEALPF